MPSGHLIFALGAAMGAGFSVAMRHSGLPLMAATAAVSALSAFGALYCYGRAIACLGPTRAALFAALVPALSTAMGAALLGEVPSTAEALCVALLSLGAALAARGGRGEPLSPPATGRRPARP